MTEMLETIARAMFEAVGHAWQLENFSWKELPNKERDLYLTAARAAVKAMPELADILFAEFSNRKEFNLLVIAAWHYGCKRILKEESGPAEVQSGAGPLKE